MRLLLSASLFLALATLPAYGDGPEPTSQPAKVNAEDVDPGMDAFLKSDLPKDIPLPEKTPFDKDPKSRTEYLDAYRNGFAGAVAGIIVTRCKNYSPAFVQGNRDGDHAGDKLYSLLRDAEHKRRFAWNHAGSTPIADDSPEADRKVRDVFAALSKRYLDELRFSYPQMATITKTETPASVYFYTFEDYSGSNAEKFVPRKRYRAVLEFDVTISAPKGMRAEDSALQGSYFREFEYLDGQWAMADWEEMTRGLETARSINGDIVYGRPHDSVLAKRLLKESFEKALKSLQP